MISTDINNFCDDLNVYLLDRYRYKREVAKASDLFRTIMTRSKKARLYLRWQVQEIGFKPNTLVIASIEFNNTRCGNATSLLQFIVDIAGKYGIKHIAIECANSEAILQFADKFGFIEYRYERNLTVSVKALRRKFQTNKKRVG